MNSHIIPNKSCVAYIGFLFATMNIPKIDQRLVSLDKACDILDGFFKEEALKREADSAKNTTKYRKKVNECVMELVYHIQKEIELKELYITHSIYENMLEIIQGRQQEIRRAISMLQNLNEMYALELKMRKLRIEEIEKKHAEMFCLRKEPEVLMGRLQQEQKEPVICLQGDKFGSIRWQKKELARCTQRLQEGRIKSPQQLQQELKCTLQALYQRFVDITRQVEQKNAEGFLLFSQELARGANVEVRQKFKQLKKLYTEITQLLQQEQKESSLHLQPRQAELATNLEQGQEIQQYPVQPRIHFQQTQSEPVRSLYETVGALSLRQNRAGLGIRLNQKQSVPVICLQQEQVVPVICLQQDQVVPTMRSQQEEERAAMSEQQEGGPTTRLLQEDEGQTMSLQLIKADPAKHLQQEQARPVMDLQQEQSGAEVCIQKEQLAEEVLLHQEQSGAEVRLQKEQSEQDMQLEQEKQIALNC
ncbi:hypothetical protein TNIN_16351 [Trichonephila inaurata madagascariensis]|uniref:Uncharacterized protein n=1 Tax=Trichonephila inaurata madagascariensis TaxID=2747483 RepID=A0A8X6XF65_9ARAC|nr:hypothetical protein TNIN_16351 [Trichonephila inaurata madagascariensis]